MAGEENRFNQDVTTPVKLDGNQASSAGAEGTAVAFGRVQTSGSGPASTAQPDRSDSTPAIQYGFLLCERFRVVRFIARGGMGEVYEAEDLELREHVALKTVLPEIAGDERAMERFKREIYLARKISSTQVCRINDLFRHKPSAEGVAEQCPREVTFLTMELLRGDSLAALIRAKKRLTTEEAFPLVKQMVEGLAAAHRVNVIHRDFKSANVMLVPEDGGYRAVVTDFGLARSGESGGDQHSLTGSDDIVGTPIYMAPEQVECAEITTRADIYALGVVMYEMVTGTWPFVSDTRLAMAMKRLTEPPVPPSQHVCDLDPRWEAAILRALARRPEDRFAKVTEIVGALQGKKPVETPSTWTGPTTWSAPQTETVAIRRKRKWVVPSVVGAVLLLALLAYTGYRSWLRPKTATGDRRPVVAVVGLQNLSGRKEDDWLATALPEMVSAELASDDKVRTVSGEDVARVKIERLLPQNIPVSKDNLPLVASDLGTSFLVTGSYVLSGQQGARELRLDLHLVTRNGDEVGTISESGSESSLSAIATRASAQLRHKLGVAAAESNVTAAIRATVPSNPEAGRLYAEGLARLRAFDAITAQDVLQKAEAIEDSPAIHSALATAWKQLGYDAKATEEAKLALDSAKKIDGLPRDFAFGLEARYDELSNQWDKAMDIYSSLRRFYPGKLEYGLRLAATQTEGGKPDQALNTYADLRKQLPASESDPRIDLGEAEANERMGRPEAQLAAAKSAAEHAAQDKLLAAPALVNQCIALDKTGKYPQAIAACKSAQQTYDVFGDEMGSAWATNNIGNALTDNGDIARARTAYQLALTVATKVGAKGHMTGALMNIGKTYFVSGDNVRAMSYYEQSLTLAKEIGNQKQTSLALNNLASALFSAGRLKESSSRYDEAANLASQMGDEDTRANALSNLAEIEMETGELPEARRNYDEALQIWKKMDAKPSIANCLASYAELLSIEGDHGGAGKKIEDALALAEEIRSKPTVAAVWLSAGQTEVDAGDFPEAEKFLAKAIPEFHEENDPDSEIYARAYLARAFLREGKTSEAGTALEPLATLKSSVKLVNLEAQISRGAWMVKTGQADSGRRELDGAIRTSKLLRLTRLQLEAQVTELESGPAPSRGQAQQVRDSAISSGYKALAARAARIR